MKKMTIVVLTTAIAAACSSGPIETSATKACSQDHNENIISTIGYLEDKSYAGLRCSLPGVEPPSCEYHFVPAPGGETAFTALVGKGMGKNRTQQPQAGYKPEDIKIWDDKGGMVTLSDKVRLTGKISVSPEGRFCSMSVERIEKVQ